VLDGSTGSEHVGRCSTNLTDAVAVAVAVAVADVDGGNICVESDESDDLEFLGP